MHEVATFHHDTLEIYYEVLGSGPRLLVFNGSGASIDSSRLLIDTLARNFTVAVHDQRGLGRTGVGASDAPYEMADYARDGAAFLDHLGWPSARIFAISFGGMVAQEFAVTWPERVERLALLCTSSGGDGGSSFPLHEMNSMTPDQRRDMGRRLLDSRFDDEWLATHPSDRALVEFRENAAPPPDPAILEGIARQIDARSRHDAYERLRAITAPTLIAGGLYDAMSLPENSRALAQQIAGSVLRFFEGGHLFIVQDSTAMPAIVEFLLNS